MKSGRSLSLIGAMSLVFLSGCAVPAPAPVPTPQTVTNKTVSGEQGNIQQSNASQIGKTQQAKQVALEFSEVKMVSAYDGWAISVPSPATKLPRVLHTTDGGHSWTDVTPKYLSSSSVLGYKGMVSSFLDATHAALLVTVSVLDPNTQAIRYQPTLVRTVNSGETWTVDQIPAKSSNEVPIELDFISRSTGYAVTNTDNNGGEGLFLSRLYKTIDGGDSWKEVYQTPSSHDATPPTIHWVSFSKDGLGFMDLGVQQGKQTFIQQSLERTTDGGHTWVPEVPLAVKPSDLSKLDFLRPGVFGSDVILPVIDPVPGTVGQYQITSYVSGDEGLSFHQSARTAGFFTQADYSSSFDDKNHAWLDLGSNLMLLQNGGSHFKGLSFSNPTTLDTLDFVDATTGFALSYHELWTTHDAGKTWSQMTAVLK